MLHVCIFHKILKAYDNVFQGTRTEKCTVTVLLICCMTLWIKLQWMNFQICKINQSLHG